MLSNGTQSSSVFGLKVVAGADGHLHSVTGPRWIRANIELELSGFFFFHSLRTSLHVGGWLV